MTAQRLGLYNAVVVSFTPGDGTIMALVPALFANNVQEIAPRVPRATDVGRIAPVATGDVVQVFFPGGSDAAPLWIPAVVDAAFDVRYVLKAGDVMTGTLQVPAGVTVPGLAVGDPDTGIGSATADTLNLFTGGVSRVSVGPTGVVATTSVVRSSTGAATSPTFSFASDTNTGMYRVSADVLALATAGVARVTLDSVGGVQVPGAVEVPTIRSVAPVDATDIGGTSAGAMYGTSYRKTTLGADHALTNVGSGSEVTILTDTFDTVRPNALVTVFFNLEARITVADAARLGIFVCKVDGTSETDALNMGYETVVLRDPRHRVFGPITLATAGSHTILIGARKNGAGGTIIAGLTNTNMILRIEQ